MTLVTSEIPKYYTKVVKKTIVLNVASAGALGSNTNAVGCGYTPTKDAYIVEMKISSDDTAAVNVLFFLYENSTTVHPESIISVPISSGNSGTTPNVDGLAGLGVSVIGSWIEMNGKRVIFVPGGSLFEPKAAVLANMTSGKKCYINLTLLEKE